MIATRSASGIGRDLGRHGPRKPDRGERDLDKLRKMVGVDRLGRSRVSDDQDEGRDVGHRLRVRLRSGAAWADLQENEGDDRLVIVRSLVVVIVG
jgi:hypothetical protein